MPALNCWPVAPPIGLPPRNHWLPIALLEVRVVLEPVQNVSTPLMVGIAGSGLIGTNMDPETMHPLGAVTVRFSVTLPEAPAVYVMLWRLFADVSVPLAIPHA